MTETKLQTLDQVAQHLTGKGVPDIERMMHQAALLALVQASNAVVSSYVLPTPLFRLSYDSGHTLSYQDLHGRAPVPKKGSTDVSLLDLTVAAMLREKISLLFEGVTGIGKTHTTEMLFRTVLPPENTAVIRLSAAMTNVQQPYVQGTIDNGVLRVNLRRDALDRIAALFVDEQNRGDTNQVLQLKDGKISLPTGESGYLGLPTPHYNGAHWVLDYDNKRPLFVTAAQNPAGTRAAQYTGTRGTDAALKNRDLEISVPNAAPVLGASLMLTRLGNGQHTEFITRFSAELNKYFGATLSANAIGRDITSWFALATDPRKTAQQDIRSALELTDHLALMFSADLAAEYDHEVQVSKDWTEQLKHIGDFSYSSPLTLSAQALERMRKVVQSFQEAEVPRDIVKVKRLADVLSLTRKVKSALSASDALGAYRSAPSYITVEDIAAAFVIVAKDKQEGGDGDAVAVVDQVVTDYVNIANAFARKMGHPAEERKRGIFDPHDPWYAVYGLSVSHALYAAVNEKQSEKAPTQFVRSLGSSVAELRRLENGSESRKPIIARMIADLGTLAGFVTEYQKELGPCFSSPQPLLPEKAQHSIQSLQDFYRSRRDHPATPAIYLQRLPRVLGV